MTVPQQIDQDKVFKALEECEIGPEARWKASSLVEAWLEYLPTFPENDWRCLFVETPFYIQLDPKFYVVGQCDAGFQDEIGVLTAEWKSRRAPKLKKDGTAYAGDDEDGWLADISNGPQLGVYALAQREGVFYRPVTESNPFPFWTMNALLGSSEPREIRILVRAAVKSNPVETWPTDYRKGLFTFPDPLLDSVKAAMISEAAAIRARRRSGQIPWALPSIHCTNMYHQVCGMYKNCTERVYAPLEPKPWVDPDDKTPDPGFEVARILNLDYRDPELVVLSASMYSNYLWCPERGRAISGGHGDKEDSFELDTGTGLHKGLASIYRQWASK